MIDLARPEFDLDAEFDDALTRLREQAVADALRAAQLKRAREMGLGPDSLALERLPGHLCPKCRANAGFGITIDLSRALVL